MIRDSIVRKCDTVLIPQVIIYPVTPNEQSIWVNRETPYNNYTPEELLRNVFISNSNEVSCNQISNVTFTGIGWNGASWIDESRSLSYFSHGSGLNIEEGLLLTTGIGLNTEGPNQNTCHLSGGIAITDADLSGMISGSITSGSILQFDFVSQIDTVVFEYVFASEEYPEYVGDIYNDVFGFFISGPGIVGTQNIALIPGTNMPVAINNVNHIINTAYYINNEPSVYCEYDGHTVVLATSHIAVIPGQTYHLKLAIANVGDDNCGSGVFLKAKSFDIGFDIINYGNMIINMENIFAGCSNNKITVTTNMLPSVSTINLNYSGTAVNDIVQLDGSPMPTTVTVPANTSQIDIFYKVKDIISINGGTFIISYASICTGAMVEKTIYVYDKITSQISATNSCNSDGVIQVSTTGGTSNTQTSIDSGINWQSTNIPFTGLASGTYTVLVRDSISCITDTFNVEIHDEKPVIYSVPDKTVCAGTTINTVNFNSSIQGTAFEWTNNNTSIGLSASGIDSIPSFIACNSTNMPIMATITVTPIYDSCTGIPCEFTITVNPVYRDTIRAEICFGENYTDENFNITPTNTGVMYYSKDSTTVSGCDSIVNLQLTVNSSYNLFINDTIYEDEWRYVGNAAKYNTSGIHITYFETKFGCDSIVNLYLDIIYYPSEITAFSPLNKDGINDYLYPGFKVQIFNRYGVIIYETNTKEEQDLGWDGRNRNGQKVEPGLYFYILYNSSGKPRIKSSVEVLKLR